MTLEGIIPPIVTPFDESGEVDTESIHDLVSFMLESGVDGFFTNGTMGEGPAMAPAECALVTRTVVEAVRGSVPVLAGVSGATLAACAANARQAREAGADAVVATQPWLFRGWRPLEMLAFFEGIANAAGLPLVIYNNPTLTGNPLDLTTLDRLFADPRVVAIKDSACSMALFMDLLRLRDRLGTFAVFQGDETAVAAALLCGADGSVPGMGSLAGRVFKALFRAARAERAEQAIRLQKQLLALFDGIYAVDKHRWLTGHKEALAYLGIIRSPCCRVYSPVTPAEREEIRACVDAHRSALLGT